MKKLLEPIIRYTAYLFYERHIYKKWFLLVVGPLRGGMGPTDQLRKKKPHETHFYPF